MKQMKIDYTFNYLPGISTSYNFFKYIETLFLAGLFNRAQVRLFQFSDKSTIWRYGSLLVKNNHRAVIIRTDGSFEILLIYFI